MKSFFGKCFDGAVFVFGIVVFVAVPFFILQNVFFPKNEPLYNEYVVSGKSMEPTFRSGDSVTVDKVSELQLGQIIAFDCLVDKCLHETVLHRLSAVDINGCMHIVGDNQDVSTFDTFDYGCLMPEEIEIKGVVVTVTSQIEANATSISDKPTDKPTEQVTEPPIPTSQSVVKPIENEEKKDVNYNLPPSYYVPQPSTVTLTPFEPPKPIINVMPVTPYVPYGTVDPDKQASCKKISNQCMDNIQYKVGHLSGSAQQSAIKAYGNTCNEEYKRCVKY